MPILFSKEAPAKRRRVAKSTAMHPQQRPVAVVTGASSGLGLDFAGEAARDGYDLVLIARSAEPMHALAERLQRDHGATAHVIAQDLALPGAGAGAAAAESIAKLRLDVEVLVNNAGFGFNGAFVCPGTTEMNFQKAASIASSAGLMRAGTYAASRTTSPTATRLPTSPAAARVLTASR